MIAARSRDHACLGNVARQQVGEGAACFERTCMLQQFQLEDDADTVEAEVGAIDFDDRCPADVGANEFVRPRDGFPADRSRACCASLLHNRRFHARPPGLLVRPVFSIQL